MTLVNNQRADVPVAIDESLCIEGCTLCVDVCPLDSLAINPDGIDPNFFYAEYLAERDRNAEARQYLEKALKAAPRPGRELADKGRREEIRVLLERLNKEAN